MRLRLPLVAVFLAILSILFLATITAGASSLDQANATRNPFRNVPVTGTFRDSLGGTGTFAGTLTVNSFAVVNSNIVANSTLAGSLVNAHGTTLGTVHKNVQMPVSFQSTTTCTVLNQTLGPLTLTLLGTSVTINAIPITVTATSGTALGNLLCTIGSLVSLLPLASVLTQITSLLNTLLSLLP